MGLYIQHGSECDYWNHAKQSVELVQLSKIQEKWTLLGHVAGVCRSMDSAGDEL